MSHRHARPRSKNTRTCADCPATIEAYGNRKRCPECQDKARCAGHNKQRRAAQRLSSTVEA